MDEIFCRRPGEPNYKKQQVIDEVHHFLCEKVFMCDEKNTAKDYIFLVCGTWAYYGRMYRKDCDEFEFGVDMEFHKIKHMKEIYPVIKGIVDSETPMEIKAPHLIDLSNITKLESR